MIRIDPPDERYPELFEAVQSARLFRDSKTFVDATPRIDVATVLQRYARLEPKNDEMLLAFVAENFDLPESNGTANNDTRSTSIRARIESLWGRLSRAANGHDARSSLIALPRPYLVPGGRFREVYYWDSYFTMLGLAASGRVDALEDMVRNFAFLIDEVGFIPNGNRTYFCTRSQPPHFVLMVELLAAVRQDTSIIAKYLPHLRAEYDFWMQGADELDHDCDATRRVVRIGDTCLNRHWDEADKPRPESYAEDLELVAGFAEDQRVVYRDIRAACESGWDFSSRWLADPQSLGTIRTTEILPVDLNTLLYRLEHVLAMTYRQTGEHRLAESFTGKAAARKEALQSLFFDEEAGFFVDICFRDQQPTGVLSLAGVYPLFLEVAKASQARLVAESLQSRFLARGGWLTTLFRTGQQWDRPTGWAPLQWVVFQGLRNYGYTREADMGAQRWVDNCLAVYDSTGRLLEKYNVEEIGHLVTEGEYEVQDGFGWTNAVLLKFMDHLGIE